MKHLFFVEVVKQYMMPLIVVMLIVVGLGVYRIFSHSNTTEEFYTVERTDLINEVVFSGTVVPAKEVSLGFELQGTVQNIGARVGDKVSEGALLATLENSNARANLLQAQATLVAEEAKLDELKKGTRKEEVAIKQKQFELFSQSLFDAEQQLIDEYIDAYTIADNAIHNTTDQLFDSPRISPQLKFDSVDYELSNKVEQTRIQLEQLLTRWAATIDTLRDKANLPKAHASIDPPRDSFLSRLFGTPSAASVLGSLAVNSVVDFSSYSALSRANINEIKTYLELVSTLVNSLTPNSVIVPNDIDTWKSAVSSARSAVVAELSALSVAEEKRNYAISTLATAKEDLALSEAGPTEDALKIQVARVDAQKALVYGLQQTVTKYTLHSPMSGVVTMQKLEVGELASAYTPVFTIASNALFEIDANVSELDIAGLSIGMQVAVTLDAYGKDEYFDSVITHIDPAETKIEGISTYKVTLQFRTPDTRVRSGMTANARTEVVIKKDVLAVPRRFVSEEAENSYVQKNVGGVIEKSTITRGAQNNGGMVEILSGVFEGEELVSVDSVL